MGVINLGVGSGELGSESSFTDEIIVSVHCEDESIQLYLKDPSKFVGGSLKYTDLSSGKVLFQEILGGYFHYFAYGNSLKGYQICLYDSKGFLVGCQNISPKYIGCNCLRDPYLVLVCVNNKMIARFSCSDRTGDNGRLYFQLFSPGINGIKSPLIIDYSFILGQPVDIEVDLGYRGTVTYISAGIQVNARNPIKGNTGQNVGSDVRTDRMNECWYYLGDFAAPCTGELEGQTILPKTP